MLDMVVPINFVPEPKPKAVPYAARALVVAGPDQVRLDDEHCPLRGEDVNARHEVEFLLGDFMVISLKDDDLKTRHVLLLRRDGMTVLADSRNPQLFSDYEQYSARLAEWRPSLDHLRKAEKNPLFAIALRIKFEFYARSLPNTKDQDDLIFWETTPDNPA